MKNKIFNFYNIFLILIIGLHVFILTKIIFFPYPEIFVYSYLTTKGLLPYKEIIDQHFPGLFFLPVNFYTLGIKTPLGAFFLHAVTIIINHILLFLIARKISKDSKFLLILNLLYAFWHPFFEGYVLWIDSLVVPIFLFAFYLLISKDLNAKFYSAFLGLVLGLSLEMKQVSVVLIFLLVGLFFLEKRYKTIFWFLVFMVLVELPVIIYFVKMGVIKDLFYWTITFNLTTFAQMGRKYPSLFDLVKAFWVYWPVFISFWLIYFRKDFKILKLLSVFLLGTLSFVYARFDFVHLQPSLPFVLISLYYLFLNLQPNILKIGLLFYFLFSFYLIIPFYQWAWGKDVLFFGDLEKRLVDKINNYSESEDKVFAFGTTPHLYFLANRLPPGNVFVFQFPWFMREAEEKILSGLITDPPRVVVRDKHAQVQGINLVSAMPLIKEYIDQNYVEAEKLGPLDILLRKEI